MMIALRIHLAFIIHVSGQQGSHTCIIVMSKAKNEEKNKHLDYYRCESIGTQYKSFIRADIGIIQSRVSFSVIKKIAMYYMMVA